MNIFAGKCNTLSMNTRQTQKSEHSNIDKRGENPKLSRPEIMGRYRQKQKNDPTKLEKACQIDRERKQKKRKAERDQILPGNKQLHEKVKARNAQHLGQV